MEFGADDEIPYDLMELIDDDDVTFSDPFTATTNYNEKEIYIDIGEHLISNNLLSYRNLLFYCLEK